MKTWLWYNNHWKYTMKTNMNAKIMGFMGSRWVFAGILGVFAAQAIHIAVTSGFPLPFDEKYHVEIIRFYAETSTPFVATQPAEMALVGDATRLTSYLFHYVLSFPLKLVAAITGDLQMQIVALRIINIGFVVGALLLFRVFIRRLMGSAVVSNVAILMFCLLPVTAFLAAHVNYDNLLLLCFAGMLVVAQSIVARLNQRKDVGVARIVSFGSILLVATLVKFTFLPIAVAAALVVSVLFLRKKAWWLVKFNLKGRAGLGFAAAVVLGLVSLGLFVERVGVNTVAYGSPQPDCAAVQPVSTCIQYGPWARNYQLEQKAATDAVFEGRSVQGFAANIWAPLMVRGLGGVDNYGIVPDIPKPVLIALLGAAALLSTGVIFRLFYRRDLMITMFVAAAGLYMIALLQRNYSEFMQFHEIVAIQGRYLLPFVIPFTAIGVVGLFEYGRLTIRSRHLIGKKLNALKELETREAYERSANYWSAKIWRRSPET
jgi:hypothetical protein